jgi:hypothetical protein
LENELRHFQMGHQLREKWLDVVDELAAGWQAFGGRDWGLDERETDQVRAFMDLVHRVRQAELMELEARR